jgi:hypothetical protein
MSNNLKYTPGPWFAVEYAGRYSFQRKDEYGDPDLLDQDSCSRAYYNAKLAASAPELLEVVQDFLQVINITPASLLYYGKTIEKAEQTIKKATE